MWSVPIYPSIYLRDKRVTEIDCNLWYAIFSTACSIVYKYCTRPIRRYLYSGIFKVPLDRKYKIFKNRQIHKCYVLCLKLEYFFKSCKNNIWNRSMACRVLRHYRPAQSIQVECKNSLCSLWAYLSLWLKCPIYSILISMVKVSYIYTCMLKYWMLWRGDKCIYPCR